MFIHEAVKIALEKDKSIARESEPWSGRFKIKPTDTPDCCLAAIDNKPPRRGWQPKAEDLLADDWTIVWL